MNEDTEILYNLILKLAKNTGNSVSLNSAYNFAQHDLKMSVKEIRRNVKWLFDNRYLKWSGIGHIIPTIMERRK